jgi:hypothetical protein
MHGLCQNISELPIALCPWEKRDPVGSFIISPERLQPLVKERHPQEGKEELKLSPFLLLPFSCHPSHHSCPPLAAHCLSAPLERMKSLQPTFLRFHSWFQVPAYATVY